MYGSMNYKTILKNRLVEQALAYLVTGIILSVSHHFHTYVQVVFFGHFLIAASLLMVVSTALPYRWMRRIAGPLDILSGTTLIITFAGDIALFVVDELTYYVQSKVLPQNLVDSLFITILVAVVVWLSLLALPLILPAFSHRRPPRTRLLSSVLLCALVLVVTDGFLRVFPIQDVVLALLLCIIAVVVISDREVPRLTSSLIYFSHLFSALALVFAIGGLLSTFTRAVPSRLFWISFLVSGCAAAACIMILSGWRKRLFKVCGRFLANSLSKVTRMLEEVRLMTKIGTIVSVVGLVMVTVGVGVFAARGTGKLADAFVPALTAALVWVTGYYAFTTARLLEATNKGVQVAAQQAYTVNTQTQIMLSAEYNAAAPVVSLQSVETVRETETEIKVIFMNVGQGPALNFRCWIEDPEHPEFRNHLDSIRRTVLAVSRDRVANEGHITIKLRDYHLLDRCVRAQYESVFSKQYESRLLFVPGVEPQLKYGALNDEEQAVIL